MAAASRVGRQRTLLLFPGGYDDSGWPALAQNPGLTGNPRFFWVTESLCLGIVSQIETLQSVSPSFRSGMTTLTSIMT